MSVQWGEKQRARTHTILCLHNVQNAGENDLNKSKGNISRLGKDLTRSYYLSACNRNNNRRGGCKLGLPLHCEDLLSGGGKCGSGGAVVLPGPRENKRSSGRWSSGEDEAIIEGEEVDARPLGNGWVTSPVNSYRGPHMPPSDNYKNF
uniref:Uncharacterized protein n=1 Tax=Arundo donax TaxID=35708 RepID=A0A0A9CWF2_ARUDO